MDVNAYRQPLQIVLGKALGFWEDAPASSRIQVLRRELESLARCIS